MENITAIVSLIVLALPFVYLLFMFARYIGMLTHNKTLITLSERALVIVKALDQTSYLNDDKKALAMDQLYKYAKELKINITQAQLNDYVESAVHTVRKITDKDNAS